MSFHVYSIIPIILNFHIYIINMNKEKDNNQSLYSNTLVNKNYFIPGITEEKEEVSYVRNVSKRLCYWWCCTG